MSSPESCPEGMYTNQTKQTGCSPCEAGHECPNGDRSVPCPAGYFSKHGQANCTSCNLGQYSPVGSNSCLPCPAGKECVSPHVDPVKCMAGTFSVQGESFCKPCAQGEWIASDEVVVYLKMNILESKNHYNASAAVGFSHFERSFNLFLVIIFFRICSSLSDVIDQKKKQNITFDLKFFKVLLTKGWDTACNKMMNKSESKSCPDQFAFFSEYTQDLFHSFSNFQPVNNNVVVTIQ